MKYVLELEASTLQEFIAHNNGDGINMDTNGSASGPGTSCTLSQIAQTYKDSLEASVDKIAKFTVKETYDYVGDLTNMLQHIADNETADTDIMTDFARDLTSAYELALTKTRANKKASKIKSKPLKTHTLSTDPNPGTCASMKAYGTLRDPRELKAKRTKSVGGC
jgi:hypothetical protein